MKHPKHFKACRYAFYAAIFPLWVLVVAFECLKKSCNEVGWQWRILVREIMEVEQEHQGSTQAKPTSLKDQFLEQQAAQRQRFKGMKP